MPSLSQAQRTWVDRFLGKSASTPPLSGSPNRADASDKRRTRVTLVNVDDLKGNPGVKRDSPDLTHSAPHKVKVFDLDQNKEYEVTDEQVKEIKKSPDFIDNFKLLRAQPDWMQLRIDKIEFIYSSGKKFFVEMKDVNHGVNHNAHFYGRKGGIYYPRDASDKLLVDAATTPHVVGGKEWIDKEIDRRKDEREKLAWLVYTFAGAVASLGGAAGGGKGGGVRPPTGGRPMPRAGAPGGGAPRGKPVGGTGGGGRAPTGTPAKPTGGTGGAPTGGGAPKGGSPPTGGGVPMGGNRPTGGGTSGTAGKPTTISTHRPNSNAPGQAPAKPAGPGGGAGKPTSGGAVSPKAKGGAGSPGKSGGSAGKKDAKQDGSPKTDTKIVKATAPGDGTSGKPTGSKGGTTPRPTATRTRGEARREIGETRTVVKDLKKEGRDILDAEGIKVPVRKEKGTGGSVRESVRARDVIKGLERVANDPGSPRQAEAKRLLDKLKPLAKELDDLNIEIDVGRRDRI